MLLYVNGAYADLKCNVVRHDLSIFVVNVHQACIYCGIWSCQNIPFLMLFWLYCQNNWKSIDPWWFKFTLRLLWQVHSGGVRCKRLSRRLCLLWRWGRLVTWLIRRAGCTSSRGLADCDSILLLLLGSQVHYPYTAGTLNALKKLRGFLLGCRTCACIDFLCFRGRHVVLNGYHGKDRIELFLLMAKVRLPIYVDCYVPSGVTFFFSL